MMVTREAQTSTSPAPIRHPVVPAPAPHAPHHAPAPHGPQHVHSHHAPAGPPAEHAARLDLRRPALVAIGVIALYAVLTALDRPAFRYFFVGLERVESLEQQDWYRLLRVLGSLWMWAAVGLLFLACDWGRVRRAPDLSLRATLPRLRWGALTRGLCVFLAAVVAGLFAEGVKRMVGRLRPIETDGDYRYASAIDSLLNPPNGTASSHTAVAFAAILVIISFYPRSAWIMLPAALGCAATRIVSGAHFLTDVYLGALLGCAAARIFTPPLIRSLDLFSPDRRPA